MRESLFYPPTSIDLVTTYKCTAACPNCCFQCSPNKTLKLSYEQSKEIIDNALRCYSKTLKLLVLTGGECFTLGNDLYKILSHASSKGLLVRIVTNGFWANSFKQTFLKLKNLKEKGLSEINVSTGDEHQKIVSFNNVINIIVAAMYLKITVAVNVETSPLNNFSAEIIKSDIRLKKFNLSKSGVYIISGKWMYFRKQSRQNLIKLIDENIKFNNQFQERCSSILTDIVVSPDKKMYSCCGLTNLFSKYLYLGNIKNNNIAFLYNNQFNDFIKIWLFTEGPRKILEFARKKGIYLLLILVVCIIAKFVLNY